MMRNMTYETATFSGGAQMSGNVDRMSRKKALIGWQLRRRSGCRMALKEG